MSARPKVVVLGGGFAGLHVAKRLANAAVDVLVIDRNNHHLFQPLLYQIATAALSPEQIASPIRSVLRHAKNVEVLLAEATAVDPAARTVKLADGAAVPYDYLVVATGARHSYFGRDQWEERAPGLKSLEDAFEIRRRVLLAFERAEREKDPVVRQRHLTFVVIGGGPTGVELAGALAEIRQKALDRDFRRIDPRDATVMLLEGGPRLLPSYPPALSQRAKDSLRGLGVDVRTETMVTDIAEGFVTAADWRIPADTVIWAAGNVASPLIRSIGGPVDRQGRALVEADCSVAGHPEIFVLGDAACYAHQPGFEALPGICPAAMQMGRYVGGLIRAEAGRKPAPMRPPFRYRDKGQLAVIGRGRAVADLGRIRAGGFVAWLLWIFVHIFFLIGFRNRVLVLIEWAWSYVTLRRGARLITGSWRPGGAST
ncbi:MAG: NAD(P)/FAD-dependent oxidoreductase [Gemmatimonadales bacterium]